MDSQISAAIIGAAATLLTGAGAVWAVVWQIGKQGRLALDQSAQNARIGLKLDVYRSVAGECETQQERIGSLIAKLTALKWRVSSHLNEESSYALPLGLTGMELSTLLHEVQGGAADLLILIERWQIIDQRLDLFRTAINSAAHNLRCAWEEAHLVFHAALPPSVELAQSWSPEIGDGRSLLNALPTVEAGLYELSGYLHDLRLEMQNLLLSELFSTPVRPRSPIDPKQIAVSLDRYDELMAYFEKNTAWGRHVDEVNEQARRLVSDRAS